MEGEPIAKRTRCSVGVVNRVHQIDMNSNNGESLDASDKRQTEAIVDDSKALHNETDDRNSSRTNLRIRTFENRAEVSEFLKNENCWSLLKSERLVKGIKTSYRCNRVKRRGNQCKASLYTLHGYDSADETTKLFRRRAEHNCEQSENRVSTKIGDEKNSSWSSTNLEILQLPSFSNYEKKVASHNRQKNR